MSEKMQFLPKKDLLTLEELDRICSVFIEMGITKLRITGGEPLVRRNILSFFKKIKSFCFAAQYSHRMGMKCQIIRPKKVTPFFS